VEIRRFGPGYRRPEGPPGTRGVQAQVIHHDGRGTVAELAFGPRALITPHSNPNTTLFVVVSGGGFVQVGEERARVHHGEAVLWPAEVPHGAYTDGTEMRAIVIELSGPDDALLRGVLEGAPAALQPGDAAPAEGSLAPRPVAREAYDASSGEPW
jgi:quercetin dioxygenase-like cupin family protein